MAPRAIGIVRVSQVGEREGERFHSPTEQRERIAALCQQEGWALSVVHDELDVSGAAALEDRPGLSQAVTAILTGSGERLVGAYTDRLWRSTEVRAQVVRLVEAAGGEVWSAEEGRISNRSGAEKFSGVVRTAADELYRDQIREKAGKAQQRAISNGRIPWAGAIPGYRRRDDGHLEPDPVASVAVAEAFALRAAGATIGDVRAFLALHGVARSYHGVQALLGSRLVLGEIHFGGYEPNLEAHPAIVDRETWLAVQRVRMPRGRRPKSDALLARVGVLLCGSCGARMVIGSQMQSGRKYAMYRCPPVGDCTRRVAISAEMVEGVVVEAVRTALADVEGRASLVENARAAEARLEAAQAELDAAIRVLNAVGDEPAALERIIVLRDARNAAQAEVDHLGGESSVVLVNAAADWDRLSLDGRRALIRAVVARVLVAPGRGPGRVSIQLVGE